MAYTPAGIGHQKTDTSHFAAISMDQSAPTIRAKALAWLREQMFGATTEEITAALGISYRAVQPRISELREKQLLKDSQERRPNKSGRAAIIWIAT